MRVAGALAASVVLGACAPAGWKGAPDWRAGAAPSAPATAAVRPATEPATSPQARAMREAVDICMSGFPTFEGVHQAFRRAGWRVTEVSPLEHEASKRPMVAGVIVGLGRDNSGCTVQHPAVSREAAATIVEEALGPAFGGVGRWEPGFGGEPWHVVRGRGPDFYAWVQGTGSSGEGPGAAIALEARPGK